jgi:hypothetical protein
MLDNYRQFIAWDFVQRPGDPKPAKVPCDPATGLPIDPHNPANWRTRQEIEATGRRVGFVFTERDPFFFLDLDDCYDGAAWHPEAIHIAAQLFPGFAQEVSISGTGLHIVGTCDKSRLKDRRHKFTTAGRAPKKWLEFYITGRFMALGQGFHGRYDLDGTDMLLQIVPQGDPAQDVDLSTGPAPGYTGPSDDDELIRRMLAAGGSIAQHMGSKARIADLWNGDASILCQLFPSASGDAYDRSSADAALMFHLAFWTGKDAARMDRLFRRSALMRAKYAERADYRRTTLQKAIGGQQKIYDAPQTAAPVGMPGEGQASNEFLVVSEMVEHFKGCVYVRDLHSIMVPGGDLLKPEQFASSEYAGHLFQMSSDMSGASGTTKNAFEAFTQCRVYKFPKVHTSRFLPQEAPGAIIGNAVNMFFPVEVETEEGDVTPFLNHVAKMLPDPTDRNILLTWMIALIQNPGVKFQWAPVLQGTQGNGTSWLASILTYAIGEKFYHKPQSDDITNKFNSWLRGKLFIDVQEIMLDGKYELIESIKDWITSDRIQMQGKGSNQTMGDNLANWFLATNHKNAIPLTQNDRRFAPLFTAHQSQADLARDGLLDPIYFPTLWNWTKTVGYKRIAHWLRTARIPDERFNPAGACQARAPQTSSTAEAIALTQGAAEQHLMECVASGDQGFRNGWISTYMAERVLTAKRITCTPQRLARIMENLRYTKVERAGVMVMEEDGKRPILYIRSDLFRPGLSAADYMVAQGYAGAPLRVVK